jgi:outer membrane protein assembly factor BamB
VFFQTAANTVYAVKAKTGAQIWRRPTGATMAFGRLAGFPEGVNWDYWTSSPLYDDGVVYIGSGDGKVHALGARDGRVLWTFGAGGRVRATAATDGNRIYVGSFDGVMYALDRAHGSLDWSFRTTGNADFPVGSIQSAAALADGLVVFGSRDYNVYALDARTGKEVWRDQHKESWAAPATPAIRDGRVYVPSSDGHFIRCNDLKTGAAIWTAPTDANVFSAPAISGDYLYAGTFGGVMTRVRLSDGKAGGIGFQDRIHRSMDRGRGDLFRHGRRRRLRDDERRASEAIGGRLNRTDASVKAPMLNLL